VVDEGRPQSVEQIVDDFSRAAKLQIRYLPEPEIEGPALRRFGLTGVHNARHAGVRAAQNDLLVFADDDATFDRHWLAAYSRAFAKHAEVMAAGGPMRPVWETTPPEWVSDLIEKFPWLLSLNDPGTGFRLGAEIFFGCNMAIRRGALVACGGFSLDLVGDGWIGDGETGLWRRLRRKGLLVAHVPDAVVYHHIPPSRMTKSFLRQRLANNGKDTEYIAYQERKPDTLGLSLRLAGAIASLFFLQLSGESIASQFSVSGYRGAQPDRKMKLAYSIARIGYVIHLLHDHEFRKLVAKEDWLTT
jgi:hypothetical protein